MTRKQANKKLLLTDEESDKFVSLLNGSKVVHGEGKFGWTLAKQLCWAKLVDVISTGRRVTNRPNSIGQDKVKLTFVGRCVAEHLKSLS